VYSFGVFSKHTIVDVSLFSWVLVSSCVVFYAVMATFGLGMIAIFIIVLGLSLLGSQLFRKIRQKLAEATYVPKKHETRKDKRKNMKILAKYSPYWIEEPTSPDDILGHLKIAQEIKPIRVATGEQCSNRVIFKQLITSGAIAICQIDSCRVGSVNENLAIMLMAMKYHIPVCPHAGGVGLCEYVQHLAIWDHVCVSGTRQGRYVEFVDHLHEHFVNPCRVTKGHYIVPTDIGYSSDMKLESIKEYEYPNGRFWTKERNSTK